MERGRNVPAMLDGQVRDAATGVEDVGGDEGSGRTGIQAGPAGAAAVRQRLVEGELGRREEDADQEPRAEIRMQEHGVLARPPQARPCRQIPLEHGPRVDVGAAPSSHGLEKILPERLQTGRHHVVVVPTPGIARHGRPRRIGHGLAREIVERDADDGARPGEHGVGIESLAEASLEIAHGPGVPGREPALQGGAVVGRRRGTYGHVVEARGERPGLDGAGQDRRGQRHDLRALTMRCARVRVRPPPSRKAM